MIRYSLQYSTSKDRTCKVWDIREAAYMDTLYGHQEAISSFSCGPTNRLLTGGEDKTIRIWKVEESTQLVFRYYICVVLCIVYSCYVNNIIHVNCRLCNTINKPICSSVLLYCILIVVDVVVVVVVVIVVLLCCCSCVVVLL